MLHNNSGLKHCFLKRHVNNHPYVPAHHNGIKNTDNSKLNSCFSAMFFIGRYHGQLCSDSGKTQYSATAIMTTLTWINAGLSGRGLIPRLKWNSEDSMPGTLMTSPRMALLLLLASFVSLKIEISFPFQPTSTAFSPYFCNCKNWFLSNRLKFSTHIENRPFDKECCLLQIVNGSMVITQRPNSAEGWITTVSELSNHCTFQMKV